MSVGIAAVALVFGGWRMLVPASDDGSQQVVGAVSNMVDTITKAEFTGAEASLDAQRNATGSYAGAQLTPPLVLVRADATSYCIEYARGPVLQHLAGPGGTAAPGHC